MFKYVGYLIIFIFFAASCTTISSGVFGSKNLHDEYGKKLENVGLKETAMGTQWFNAAEAAIAQPQKISLPYKEAGYFPVDKPAAVSFSFSVKQGEKVLFELEKNPATGYAIYADLWRQDNTVKPSFVTSFDTANKTFSYEVKKAGNLILRLQPELLKSGSYALSITVGPSQGFPVAGKNARIGSFFGDARDAGSRKHEGIDIFAPFRTPAIATANGVVTRVNENTLGGKVVWFQPNGEDYTLYYAHLDEQVVSPGQQVKAGDTLGLVGNTGNAKTTPSHLHFGIYTFTGAINPLPFINPVVKLPMDVKVSGHLYEPYRTLNSLKLKDIDSTISKYTLGYPVAVTGNDFRVQFPNGLTDLMPATSLQLANNPLKQISARQAMPLYESPDQSSPVIKTISINSKIAVVAYYERYAFVQVDNTIKGWINF